MTTPLPLVGPPPPNLTSPTPTSRASAVAYYVSQLDSYYGTAAGQSFQSFANAHPSMTAYNALQAWAVTVVGTALGKALGVTAKSTGDLVTQIAKGTIAGAQAIESNPFSGIAGALAGFGHFVSDLTNPQMWLRIGKVALGAILLLIGVAQISHADKVITSVAGAAVKVVK